jgi:hypothetical protein
VRTIQARKTDPDKESDSEEMANNPTKRGKYESADLSHPPAEDSMQHLGAYTQQVRSKKACMIKAEIK